MKENPFEIKTPEQNSAQDVVDLFVDVFPDFYQVLEKGHTFINGPRVSGKSMMFRYIQPDCHCLAKHCQISELDYFAVYVPIKLTNINIPDLARLETHAEIIILIFGMFFLTAVLTTLLNYQTIQTRMD